MDNLVLGLLGLPEIIILVQLVHQLVVVVPGQLLQATLGDEPRRVDQLVLFLDCLQVLEQETDLSLHPQELNLIRLLGVNNMFEELVDQLGGDSAGVGVLCVHVLEALVQCQVVTEVIILRNTVTDGVEQEDFIKEVTDVVLPFIDPPRVITYLAVEDRELSLHVVVGACPQPRGVARGVGVFIGPGLVDGSVGSAGGASRTDLGSCLSDQIMVLLQETNLLSLIDSDLGGSSIHDVLVTDLGHLLEPDVDLVLDLLVLVLEVLVHGDIQVGFFRQSLEVGGDLVLQDLLLSLVGSNLGSPDAVLLGVVSRSCRSSSSGVNFLTDSDLPCLKITDLPLPSLIPAVHQAVLHIGIIVLGVNVSLHVLNQLVEGGPRVLDGDIHVPSVGLVSVGLQPVFNMPLVSLILVAELSFCRSNLPRVKNWIF